MRKFTAIFKKPVRFPCGTPQNDAWKAATPETRPDLFGEERIAVLDSGEVWARREKHTQGVGYCRAAGGVWRRVPPLNVSHYGGVEDWLAHVGAVPAKFRGGPNIKGAANA